MILIIFRVIVFKTDRHIVSMLFDQSRNNSVFYLLGRLPLWAKISFSCIKFWEHLLTSENTLVFKIFQATKNFNPLAKKLYSIFNSLGFSYIAEEQLFN